MATVESPVTSQTLLGQLRSSDNHLAWCEFLKRYQPLINQWCRRLGLQHADAEEVAGSVLAKITKEMATFEYDPARRFRGWLKTVVQREVFSLWRERGRRPGAQGSGDTDVQKRLEQVAAPGDGDDLGWELEDGIGRVEGVLEAAARVKTGLRESHTWQAFWLTAVEGETAQDVARKLGMTTGSVYVAKKRVRDALRKEMARLMSRNSDRP